MADGRSRKPGDRRNQSRSTWSRNRAAPGSRRRPTESRSADRAGPKHPPVHLSDEIVKELQSTARPGKGDILVKLFSEAAGAFAAEDYPEAIRLGEQAKHIALRAASVRELLGLAYYRAEQWRDAARELSAFRRLSGSTEQNPVIADCYRATNKPEKALELCDEIDVRSVDRAVAYEGHIVAAGALTDMGRIDEAIARLEALDLRPSTAREYHLRVWYVLGDLLEKKGRFTQAREWFEAVAGADPDLTDASERAGRLRRRA
ncbi:MAG: tetratricopeptide repeat protein [Actinomycetota bacterium]|nr:tetratricopeptide repeat protein [Actinomycetota bacterium]